MRVSPCLPARTLAAHGRNDAPCRTEACVTEPLRSWLHVIVVSGSFHIYVSQSSRGEMVMGASLDPYEVHSTRYE